MTVLEHRQLNLDGGEEELRPPTRAHRGQGLSPNQRQVVEDMRAHGGMISPGRAGKIVHGNRRLGCARPYDPFAEVEGRVACCPYACADGLILLHALERRGLVERISRGIYALVDA